MTTRKEQKALGKNIVQQAKESNLIDMIKTYNEYFETMSTNQVYIQENQVEFEKYLKDILEGQKHILNNQQVILKKIRELNNEKTNKNS